MSKELRELYDKLRAVQDKAQSLMNKEDITADELLNATKEIDGIKAKIEIQKALDSGKNFDENGIEVVEPLNKLKITTYEDKYSSLEYRNAFKEFCINGTMTPIIKNADTKTTTGDATAVIPTTILQEVIKKQKNYGQIYAAVRKMSIQGGLSVPVSSLKPTASWVGEGYSDRQKMDLSKSITFNFYPLECKISTSLLADTVTLALFESTLTDLLGEAITKALDTAIIKGTGTQQPLGIVNDSRIPEGQIITLSPTEFIEWASWKKKVFAKMPLAYTGGASFYMAHGTFEGYIDGMVDKNGQPVGRVNYGITNGPQESFGGKSVIQVEDDIIANYDDAAEGDVVTIFANLNNYAINSNLQLQMYRYTDNDKNELVDKAILIVDGKILDPNGFVIVKKGAA